MEPFTTDKSGGNQAHSHPLAPPDVAVAHVERLLSAIDRLRGERDALRRQVHFLETEAKFAVEASNMNSRTSTGSETKTVPQGLLRRMDLAVTTSAVVIGYLQRQADAAADQFTDDLTIMRHQLNEKEERLTEFEVKLEVTVQCLSDATSQCSDLQSQIYLLESRDEERVAELDRMGNMHKETQNVLECTEASLVEVTASLEEIQSERDSLSLQLTNLQTDLYNAQQELTEAEHRYSTLQFHQLSSMSSNEVIQSLREQIEELDNRVLRRTEQIGIHQHDIKRLETNLRLQEERIAEMTVELEMLSAQKEAMVEDCADAREARDEAIQMAERLEVEVEELEGRTEQLGGKLRDLEREREVEVSSLVSIVAKAINHSRDMVKCARDAENEVEIMRKAEDGASTNSIRNLTLALAVSQHELNRTSRTLQVADRAESSLQDQLTRLREELATSLTQYVDTRRFADQQVELVKDLEIKLRDLSEVNADIESTHQAAIQDLVHSKERPQERLVETEQLGLKDIHGQLERLRDQHMEELAGLQTRLDSTADDLAQAQRLYSEAEARYQEALNESAHLKQELADNSQATFDRSNDYAKLEGELSNLRAKHAEELAQLQQRLDMSIEEVRKANSSLNDLQGIYQQKIDKLAQTEEDYENRVSQVHQLETELTKGARQSAVLQAKLDASSEVVGRLEKQLQEELDQRTMEKETHERALNTAAEEFARAESVQAKAQQEADALHAELDRTRLSLKSLQEEKDALRIDMTNLEAEIQRSISLGRYLESQAKDRCVLFIRRDSDT